jgi:uncharacterized lipoprotein YajG
MKKQTGKALFIFCALLVLFLVGGCSTASKTYLLNFNYNPAAVQPFINFSDKPVTVAVYQFEDVRPDRLYLGRRVYPDRSVDFYKPDAGNVEQVVTKSMVRLLEKAGFKVVTVNQYLDSKKVDFKDIPGDVAFGGKIESLWVEAKKSQYQLTDTDAQIKLAVAWGLVKDGTWLLKMIEGSGKETKRPWYQSKNAEDMINEVFKDILDKLLKDESALKEKMMGGK